MVRKIFSVTFKSSSILRRKCWWQRWEMRRVGWLYIPLAATYPFPIFMILSLVHFPFLSLVHFLPLPPIHSISHKSIFHSVTNSFPTSATHLCHQTISHLCHQFISHLAKCNMPTSKDSNQGRLPSDTFQHWCQQQQWPLSKCVSKSFWSLRVK